jgi:hypothetical protein
MMEEVQRPAGATKLGGNSGRRGDDERDDEFFLHGRVGGKACRKRGASRLMREGMANRATQTIGWRKMFSYNF